MSAEKLPLASCNRFLPADAPGRKRVRNRHTLESGSFRLSVCACGARKRLLPAWAKSFPFPYLLLQRRKEPGHSLGISGRSELFPRKPRDQPDFCFHECETLLIRGRLSSGRLSPNPIYLR